MSTWYIDITPRFSHLCLAKLEASFPSYGHCCIRDLKGERVSKTTNKPAGYGVGGAIRDSTRQKCKIASLCLYKSILVCFH